jgi:dinuclear metal center YbgI/SA1388 family protein
MFAAIRRPKENRGARIRTGDLADPNGARYQAAPRPDAPAVSHTPPLSSRPMPAPLQDILQELTDLLQPDRFKDYCPNGLQVPGAEYVTTVATGVSAHLQLFARARQERAELVLTHHGILWGAGPPTPIDRALKQRLKALFDTNTSLAAYHLPLDAHAQLGNNAQLARALGADMDRLQPFALHGGQPIGFLAHLPGEGLSPTALFTRVKEITAQDEATTPQDPTPQTTTPLIFAAGPARIQSIAIVSGAGANFLPEAIAAGADAFLTGEPAERVMAESQEAGLHFIAAGHYATETFGVKRLGERLQERFGVRHVFIDIPNPI